MHHENEIIDEIHRHRAENARECGYDIGVMFGKIREGEKRLREQGWNLVTLRPRPAYNDLAPAETESCILREEPPK